MNSNHLSKPSRPDFRNGMEEGAFKDLEATALYCPRCKQANPVRRYLLLVLPEGDKYEYRCALCSEPVGTKIDRQEKPLSIIF